ncbi:MAG: hypothetical protein IJF15_05445 [Oscillospiraceae bacterium]|nr:hypothetical protein [Oscillospiraceae bacterium]
MDFVEFKTLTRNTVGSTSDHLLQETEIIIGIYSQLQSVEGAAQQINDRFLALDPPILAISRIGMSSAAYFVRKHTEDKKHRVALTPVSKKFLHATYFV